MLTRTLSAVSLTLLAVPAASYASEQLVPAGSLIQCTVEEAKISSKTMAIGDPVLCKVSHVEVHGRSVLPYNSYLVGHFEAYKDPGHLVGKGWMELKFDHMVIEPDRELAIDARVVEVPNYNVDTQGRILGKGHPVRDTVEWLIPVLWPIDLINLPRRGPVPVLKAETRLKLKLMDDLGIPTQDDFPRQQALIERNPPQQQQYVPTPQQYAPQPQQQYSPQQQAYAAPPQQSSTTTTTPPRKTTVSPASTRRSRPPLSSLPSRSPRSSTTTRHRLRASSYPTGTAIPHPPTATTTPTPPGTESGAPSPPPQAGPASGRHTPCTAAPPGSSGPALESRHATARDANLPDGLRRGTLNHVIATDRETSRPPTRLPRRRDHSRFTPSRLAHPRRRPSSPSR